MYKKTTFTFGTITYNHSAVTFAREVHTKDACYDTYSLIYIAQGTGNYYAEGVSGILASGKVMLLSPFEYHKLTPQANTPFEFYRVSFQRSSVLQDVNECFDNLFKRDIKTRVFMSPSIILHSLLERIESCSTMPQDERELYVKMLFSEIIMILSFNSSKESSSEKSELGARVIKYLNENIDRDLSLDYIAQRFFVSKYHLCRAFKKHNGISVHGYINKKRVLYAKSLIEAGESAQDAAYKVGFGDYSAFYRAYFKLLGYSPTAEVRNKVLKEER